MFSVAVHTQGAALDAVQLLQQVIITTSITTTSTTPPALMRPPGGPGGAHVAAALAAPPLALAEVVLQAAVQHRSRGDWLAAVIAVRLSVMGLQGGQAEALEELEAALDGAGELALVPLRQVLVVLEDGEEAAGAAGGGAEEARDGLGR